MEVSPKLNPNFGSDKGMWTGEGKYKGNALNIDQNNLEAKAPLSSTRKREGEERLQSMQTDQRQTSSVSSATGTVIPASDWPATPDTVPE